MSSKGLNSKKLRALLNAIREACIYRAEIPFEGAVQSFKLTALELRETSFRDLENTRTLVCGFKNGKISNGEVLLEDQGETYGIPLTLIMQESDRAHLTFCISEARPKNRRTLKRERTAEAYYSPALLNLSDSDIYPISVFVKLIDFDSNGICFEIRIPLKLNTEQLINSTVRAQSEAFADRADHAVIKVIRDYRVEEHFSSHITYVTAVSLIQGSNSVAVRKRSIIQATNAFSIEMKPLAHNAIPLVFPVKEILEDGFFADLSMGESSKLPKYFIAEHPLTRLRFSVSRTADGFLFFMLTRDLGHRTQWYCFLSSRALGIYTQFVPDDSRDVTRLMLESGNYKATAISKVALLHDYLESKWPLEDGLSRTKFRWLVRDINGAIIGHTAGLRVSESLWAAIDNVGSQSYSGSWNREFVSKWIRSFAELLGLESKNSLVQWTYSLKAGIWAEFEKRLEAIPDLVYCKNSFSDYFPDNFSEQLVHSNKLLTYEDVSSEKLKELLIANHFKDSTKRLIQAITVNKENPNSFENDFLLDYGIEHERFFKLIKKNGVPKLLVSYSNYPYWSSLNKGHDWVYLFDFIDSGIVESEEAEILALVKTMVIQDGCLPFRMALVDSDYKFSGGNQFSNLLFRPAALLTAAETTEVVK